jgi:hypothetical protein
MEDKITKRLKTLQKKIKRMKNIRKDIKLAQMTNNMLQDDDMFGDDSPRITTKKNTIHSKSKQGTNQQGAKSLSNSSRSKDSVYAASGGVGNSSPNNQKNSGTGHLISSPHAPNLSENPMNPRGTVKEKLRSLFKYKQQLQQRLAQLKKQQSVFRQRSKKLKNEEKARNHRK